LAIAKGILMSFASKYIAIVFPFVIIAFYILQHIYLRTLRQMRFLDIEYKAPLYSHLAETLSGLPTIRAFQWERNAEKKNLRILDDSQKPNYLLYCIQRWLVFSVDIAIAIIAIVLITITTTLRAQIGAGYIGVALVSIIAFSGAIKATITAWVTLEMSIGAVARIKNFVAETQTEGASSGPVEKPQKTWPSAGAIEIQDISASYP
jgi:ATP-binding cassette, subfamily C (CFTR/MRP), member 1